ncbi:caspase recruitment domain-containing protein 8-like [Rhynchocyon petersi]
MDPSKPEPTDHENPQPLTTVDVKPNFYSSLLFATVDESSLLPQPWQEGEGEVIESSQLELATTAQAQFAEYLPHTELGCRRCIFNQFRGPEGNVDVELIDGSLNRYRVHFPTAGWYVWPDVGLGFRVRAAVTVKISLESWDQNLDVHLKQDEHWMVAGPLFDITVEPQGAVSKIHLPHFVSLLKGSKISDSWFQVAHFKDEGMALEQPTRVEPFHAVQENPSFSLMGILLWIATGTRLSVPITTTTLIYYHHHPEDTRFHIYLIPSDALLRKAIDEEEARFDGVRLQVSPPVEPLNFGSYYIVSSSPELVIMPKELKLSYRSPDEIQPFSKVYAGEMKQPIHLKIMDKMGKTLVWETLVKPVDLHFRAASALPTLSGAAFVKKYRRQLQARMGELGEVLDDLQDNKVLTEGGREQVEQGQIRQNKNRILLSLLENKGDQALGVLYHSLSEKDPYLIASLESQTV